MKVLENKCFAPLFWEGQTRREWSQKPPPPSALGAVYRWIYSRNTPIYTRCERLRVGERGLEKAVCRSNFHCKSYKTIDIFSSCDDRQYLSFAFPYYFSLSPAWHHICSLCDCSFLLNFYPFLWSQMFSLIPRVLPCTIKKKLSNESVIRIAWRRTNQSWAELLRKLASIQL